MCSMDKNTTDWCPVPRWFCWSHWVSQNCCCCHRRWEKFPLPPSAAGGGAFSAGETVARWFPASQSPAAAVSRDFRRRQGAPKRAPHPFSQARLTHPHQPPSTLPGPPCLHSPRPDGFPGKSVLVRTPFQSHIICQLSVKDPWIRESLSHLHMTFVYDDTSTSRDPGYMSIIWWVGALDMFSWPQSL